MTKGFLLFAFADNPVVWGIVALALLCYIVELDLMLGERDAQWKRKAGTWLKVLPTLLGALPLLGLLGTVNGLLTTFRTLAGSAVRNELDFVSTGVADALVTTQLGMITVIPGLLLYTYLRRRQRELPEP
ncbi:MAG TPA: MotA/TolQ/ExbB proton channel family protein [Gammaproteobacteria bacterium]|nr:MotA/TolQ/ExbB proton channel family protein [Gammaproteobacteria bacterium]